MENWLVVARGWDDGRKRGYGCNRASGRDLCGDEQFRLSQWGLLSSTQVIRQHTPALYQCHFLGLILHYSSLSCNYWEKVDEGYKGPPCPVVVTSREYIIFQNRKLEKKSCGWKHHLISQISLHNHSAEIRIRWKDGCASHCRELLYSSYSFLIFHFMAGSYVFFNPDPYPGIFRLFSIFCYYKELL